jgi:DNA-binding CsgD family transcriptional regulator
MHTESTHQLDPLAIRVLALSARGLSTAEVAAELGADPDEVRGALRRAMAELGARSKLEAIILALRAGLIVV